MKIITAALYVCATILLSWVVCNGDWSTAAVTGVAVAMAAVPSVLVIRETFKEDAFNKVAGSVHASERAFMREIRTMDHEHAQRLREIANAEGAALQRAQTAESKLVRMTDRPRIKGRWAKTPELPPGHHDVIDAQALPTEDPSGNL